MLDIINFDKRNYGPDYSHCMPRHFSFSCNVLCIQCRAKGKNLLMLGTFDHTLHKPEHRDYNHQRKNSVKILNSYLNG